MLNTEKKNCCLLMPLINYLVEVRREMGGGLQCQRVGSGKNTLEAGQTPVTHTHTHKCYKIRDLECVFVLE